MSDLRTAAHAALEALEWHASGCCEDSIPQETVDALSMLRAALAEQQAEPDMRHPKIQALIGAKARKEIELMLVDQLLDNPDCDLTAMNMEYYNSTHERLHAALTMAQPQQAEPENPWRAVIDEALIASCLDCIGADEAPVAALARLVRWEVQIALDPAVSSPAAALVQRGRDDATPQQAEPAHDCERRPFGDLRNAKWLDPECYAAGACQSLKFKTPQPQQAEPKEPT